MAEDLQPKVREVLRQTGERFEIILPGSTDRFVRVVTPAFDSLLNALDRFAEPDVQSKRGKSQPDAYSVVWHLLWDACNSLLGAFTLFQRGYETDTLAVTRGVLERVACAIVLFDNQELLPRFKAEKLPNLSTDAIGAVAQVIPDLPKAWGGLSQLGAHISPENVGTGAIGLVKDDKGHHLHMAIGGRLPTDATLVTAWGEMVDELCVIAGRILVPAPELILFNPRRVRAAFRKAARKGDASEVM